MHPLPYDLESLPWEPEIGSLVTLTRGGWHRSVQTALARRGTRWWVRVVVGVVGTELSARRYYGPYPNRTAAAQTARDPASAEFSPEDPAPDPAGPALPDDYERLPWEPAGTLGGAGMPILDLWLAPTVDGWWLRLVCREGRGVMAETFSGPYTSKRTAKATALPDAEHLWRTLAMQETSDAP